MKFAAASFLIAAMANAASAQSIFPEGNQYDVCTEFCKGALSVCEGQVDWVTGAVSTPFSRHDQKAGRGGSVYDGALGKPEEQFQACHDTCMGWHYFRVDRGVWNERFFNGFATGDTLNCRWNHLAFAQGLPSFYYGLQASESESAAQHCQHVTPDGGWVCTDYRNKDGKTPNQLMKEAFLKRRVGDCFLMDGDKIADCSTKALRDDNVGFALAWLPDDVEYIYLVANALTMVPDISRFSKLKGIYLENNSIKELQSHDFASNPNLEVINLANNLIGKDTFMQDYSTDYAPPQDLLQNNSQLKAFYLHFNYVSELPEDFFQPCKDIEMIALVDNNLSSFPPYLLKGLKKLKLFAMGQQGKGRPQQGGTRGQLFTEAGFPDELFDDCESLEYFSNFINAFSHYNKRWFEGTPKLESFATFLNGVAGGGAPLTLEDGLFDYLPNLIDFTMYSSSGFGYPGAPPDLTPETFEDNDDIKAVLDGSQFVLVKDDAFRSTVFGLPHPLGDDRELYPAPPSTIMN